MQCSVCGGASFARHPVLWPALIDEWQISPMEADYIDRQQGEFCNTCGSNLRSIALANALRAFLGTNALLREVVTSPTLRNLAVLEINEAGTLTPLLKSFSHYVFGAYPDVDMHALPYENGMFDIVIHSDTLEHIQNPVHALAECRRVLKPNGALCFTVPIIVGRLSRNRAGLPKSYHGDPKQVREDFAVETEFGADAWAYVMEAGFTDISIHSVSYPAGIALLARNGWV
jgi:SAM-dependent methyltransferase